VGKCEELSTLAKHVIYFFFYFWNFLEKDFYYLFVISCLSLGCYLYSSNESILEQKNPFLISFYPGFSPKKRREIPLACGMFAWHTLVDGAPTYGRSAVDQPWSSSLRTSRSCCYRVLTATGCVSFRIISCLFLSVGKLKF
jgi:hypothetical protein